MPEMNSQDAFLLDKKRIRTSFADAAATYDAHDVLQRELRARLLERLGYIRLEPHRIIDLGCGPGPALKPLSRLYRGAEVYGLDLAEGMARRARRQWRWPRRPLVVCADMEHLPLASAGFDLAVSVAALQWLNDLDQAFGEVRRILAPGGLWMFTTFGPDTLRELRAAFASVAGSGEPRVNAFIDMHDIGDALIRAGFADPVMDQEVITLTYPDFASLLGDLRGVGVRNTMHHRSRGLFGPRRLQAVEQYFHARYVTDGRWPLTWEVVHGHAWVSQAPPPSAAPGKFIPILARD
jgi:malonyl-CoA O-methyltransferase